MNPLPKIGFVGAGRMGGNMARRLRECGYKIAAIFDADRPSTVELAAEISSQTFGTLREVTAASDIIFTVVTDDRSMSAIYEQPDDSLFIGGGGKLFINCATISPAVHVRLEQKGREMGIDVLEAPMASSIPQARAGTLYLMLGGRPEVFERARPVLENLAASMKYIGPAGSASSLKALVNMVMNINTAGLAEGLGLAEAVGLDLNVVLEVFAQTGANSRVLETDGPDMRDREHSTFFSAAHAAKDSGIALSLAQSHGLQLPMVEACKAQYDRMIELGLGGLDKSGISELTFPSRIHSR